MIETYYVCPQCGLYSGNLTPTDEIYECTIEQIQAQPYFLGIDYETLQCQCGWKGSWFDMRTVITSLAFYQGEAYLS